MSDDDDHVPQLSSEQKRALTKIEEGLAAVPLDGAYLDPADDRAVPEGSIISAWVAIVEYVTPDGRHFSRYLAPEGQSPAHGEGLALRYVLD